MFKFYKNKQIYSYNKRVNKNGSSDFWESAIAHPDILLSDIVKIIYPDLLPNHELFYVIRLE